MADIKLFVCCHQPTPVPEHPLLVPIQVGAAIADTRFPDFLYDDTGDNISARNRSYCELTAQYWAWKNFEADYYGFFHYRRYLYPQQNVKWPYRIETTPTPKLLDKLGYDAFASIIGQYELIVPLGENMYVPVREHYANASYHHRKDLELVEEIVCRRHPEMVTAIETYLAGTVCYFGNIHIMKRQVFHDYCSWLFSILEEFDRRTDLADYSAQELRVDGYLAERLLGIYYVYWRQRLTALELPRVHFGVKEPFKKTANYLVPPGSRRRAKAKYIYSTINNKGRQK